MNPDNTDGTTRSNPRHSRQSAALLPRLRTRSLAPAQFRIEFSKIGTAAFTAWERLSVPDHTKRRASEASPHRAVTSLTEASLARRVGSGSNGPGNLLLRA